jgi:hypothetical protein
MSRMVRVSSPGGSKTYISSPKVNISCGLRVLLFDWYCGPFREREKAGSWDWPLLSSAKVKYEWSCPPLPARVFMVRSGTTLRKRERNKVQGKTTWFNSAQGTKVLALTTQDHLRNPHESNTNNINNNVNMHRVVTGLWYACIINAYTSVSFRLSQSSVKTWVTQAGSQLDPFLLWAMRQAG